MFTGLVRAMGRVVSMVAATGDGRLEIDVSGLDAPPELGASVAVDGVCLTVSSLRGPVAGFDLSGETASRTTLSRLAAADPVNLEPSLRMGDEVGGHWVLGHVDATASLLSRRGGGSAAVLRFSLPEPIAGLVAEKGSVAVAGVSLTVSAMREDWFETAVIPETLARTTLGFAQKDRRYNIEADALARYAARWLAWRGQTPGITEAWLREQGF